MSDKKSKLYIFVAKSDRRVIGTKLSRNVAFEIELTEATTYVVEALPEFPPLPPLECAYDPIHGLSPVAPPRTEELEGLRLLKRKIDCLIFLYAKLELINLGIKAAFDVDDMRTFPISRESFFVYWVFMSEEKALLQRKKRRFLREFRRKIDRAASDEELDAVWKELRYSKTISFLTPVKDTGILNDFAKD